MRKRLAFLTLAAVIGIALSLPMSGMAVAQEECVISVVGVWSGDELTAFEEAVAPFMEENGCTMDFESTRDPAVLRTAVDSGNPPDIAILPQPGVMYEYAADGALVALDSFMDMDALAEDYAPIWLELGSYDGTLYGIFYKVANKSLIWYNPVAFEEAGYEIPTTWDELIALSDQIVADGGTPWSIGLESGDASGWPGTDWIEDIMLRTAGPEVYDQWVNHEISWTDEAVVNAFETWGQIVGNPDYLYGGVEGTLATNFGEAPWPLWEDPPGAYMHRQASFIVGFILDQYPDLEMGTDINFFPFPSINEEIGPAVIGGADVVVMFNDRPEVEAFMEYLASPEPQEIWASMGDFISPNQSVSLDVYPDDATRSIAEAVVNAEIFRFDASDLMPAAVGAGEFWSGVLDFVENPDNLMDILERIEEVAADAYAE